MVVNHLDKLFVTSDASTIINEMEVQHPAAKLVVFASQAQEQEIGDGSNFVSTCHVLRNQQPSLGQTVDVAMLVQRRTEKALCGHVALPCR